MEKSGIEVGQIWEVITDDFITSGKSRSNKYKRGIQLAKGERIEIRFPFEWNFRTYDNFYLHAAPDQILQHCKLFGTIWEPVRFENKANLEEILRLKLYTTN